MRVSEIRVNQIRVNQGLGVPLSWDSTRVIVELWSDSEGGYNGVTSIMNQNFLQI